jgi:hypothetical protein
LNHGVTKLPLGKLTVEQTFAEAMEYDLDSVMIIGLDPDDEFVSVHSSMLRKDALWFHVKAIFLIMGVEFAPDD